MSISTCRQSLKKMKLRKTRACIQTAECTMAAAAGRYGSKAQMFLQLFIPPSGLCTEEIQHCRNRTRNQLSYMQNQRPKTLNPWNPGTPEVLHGE